MVIGFIIASGHSRRCVTLGRVKTLAENLCFAALLGSATFAQTALHIPAGSDAATEIPISIIKGAKPGPTLAVLAGLSGTDYGPMIALHQLGKNLDPAAISGTLILVHIANLPAFLGRSISLSPIDQKDLIRSFPGKPDGTVTERIAHALTTQVIDKADAVVVVEAGAINTMLAPHVLLTKSGDAELDAKVAAMTMAFGIGYIVAAKAPPGSPENIALARSKPALKVMCGALGMNDQRTTDTIVKGVLGLMNMFGLIPDNANKTRSPVYFDSTTTVVSPITGFLEIYIQRGQNIRKGEPLFGIIGFNGKNKQIANSPIDGIILSIQANPPIQKGEPIALIGIPREP